VIMSIIIDGGGGGPLQVKLYLSHNLIYKLGKKYFIYNYINGHILYIIVYNYI